LDEKATLNTTVITDLAQVSIYTIFFNETLSKSINGFRKTTETSVKIISKILEIEIEIAEKSKETRVKYVTKFWKITHTGAPETIRIFSLSWHF